jgi:hypothetical protein
MKISLLVPVFLAFGGLTAQADTLRLKNGDLLTGTTTKKEGGKVYFKSDFLGDLVIKESDVDSSKTGAAPSAAEVAAPASAPTASPAIGVASSTGSTDFKGQAGDANKPNWTRSISFGGAYNSAVFEQGRLKTATGVALPTTGESLKLPGATTSYQGALSVVRTTQTDAHSFDATTTFSDSEPNGTVADTSSGVFAWNHKLSDRTYTVSRTSYTVDNVRNIDYSAIQLAGFGYKVVNTQQTKFDIIPGVLLMREKKGNEYDDRTIFGVGFAQNLAYFPYAFGGFEQKVLYRRSVKDSKLWIADAYIGFKGMLSAQLGVTVGISYVYDNTLGPLPTPFNFVIAQKKDLIQTNYGLQYKF